MSKKNSPVIIGAAQFTQRKGTPQPLDSLSLMVKTSQDAIKNTKAYNIIDFIDAIYMVNISSWTYEDAPGELGDTLNISPKEKFYSVGGGQTPQMLVNRAAKAISSGEHRCVLITGGEAAYSINKTFKGKRPQHWPKKQTPKYINGENFYLPKIVLKYGMYFPSIPYAIFETALRSSAGRDIEEHRKYMGTLLERFSKVASENPFSWTQQHFTAEEITTPSTDNRRVVYPYTKRMCANNNVDQAGTIIITNEEIAESLSIDKEHWVYIMGGSELKNINEIYRRPHLDDSPATRESSGLALEQAGLNLSDIDKFDLYSCFPSIVEIFMKELDITDDDPRDLTLTGGLPFFGTPLSNYSLHAIINTVDSIRADPSLKVMVIANGGYNTKQSIGIYGSKPPKIPWGARDDSKIQESILEKELPEPIEKASGQLRVEGYSIIYNRSGEPKRGIIIGTLKNKGRALAIVQEGSEILSYLETQEGIGKIVTIQYDSTVDRNIVTSME
jgi:acetyl-CoA C-acetyltransferase